MNFDTRTIIDMVNLNEDFLDDIKRIIHEESILSEKIGQYDYDIFVDSLKPTLKSELNLFLKKKLSQINLPILKGLIDINKIDYSIFVNEIQK
jgi:hypothetical protein